LKVNVNEALLPAASVKGNVSPLTVNSELFKLSDETVTLATLADRLPVTLLLEPTTTLPKFVVVEDTANRPELVPSPERFTFNVEFEVLKLMETLPLALLLVCGAKVILKVTLWPPARVKGRFRPPMLKPDPATVALERVMLDSPEFVSVSNCVSLLPTCTLPKLMLVGLAVSDLFPAAPNIVAAGRRRAEMIMNGRTSELKVLCAIAFLIILTVFIRLELEGKSQQDIRGAGWFANLRTSPRA